MEQLTINQLYGNEKILLIDDEKPILNMVGQILLRSGYQVTLHDISTEAFNCFEGTPYEFDIVVTDMTMSGITGEKLVTKIKQIRPEIPVILYTGFSEEIVNDKINGTRPDMILTKPIGKDELLKSIRFLLDN